MFIFKNILPKQFSPKHSVIRTLKLSTYKDFVGRKKESKLCATKAHLKVLGSGAPDQPASVILSAVDRHYLFNCGEGISRLSKENNVSIKEIDHAFFTQAKWNCIGGITSLIFATIAHSGNPPTFHGSNNLKKIFQRMSYLSTVGDKFKKHEGFPGAFNTDERFEDKKVVIDSVKLSYLEDEAIVYLCKLKGCQGAFSVKKSLDLNLSSDHVPKLYKGEDVTLDDGTVITPDQVRDQDWPDMYIMFVDIPAKGFLKDLATNEKLRQLLAETKSNGVEVIVHFTPNNVFRTPRYQHFIETVNAKRNLIVNDSNKFASMECSYILQSKLNKIDSKVHPLLRMKLERNHIIYNPNNTSSKDFGKLPTFYKKYILRSDLAETVFSEESEDDTDTEELNGMLDKTKESLNEIHAQKSPPKLKYEQFPRILFLGTGSADSFQLRNSTGILVHLSKDHSILLDCGSGTANQINRFYGAEAPQIYHRIKAVYVSHMHLDHFIGLPEIFRWREIYLPENREPLRLFCPFEDLKSWLFFYANHIQSIHKDMQFIDNEILLKDDLNYQERRYLNIDSIQTCPVEHFRKSYALSLIIPYRNNGEKKMFKMAYSGDIGLSNEFVRLGANADLLIHEATFQDELKDWAEKNRHSTISMAIEQSQRMHAKHTILTHFSSRYHLLPYIDVEIPENTGIAFDFMEVTPSDLPKLNSLYLQYRKMFPKVSKSLQKKTKKYLLRGLDE